MDVWVLSSSLELHGVSTILRYLARAGKDGLYGSDALSAVQVRDTPFSDYLWTSNLPTPSILSEIFGFGS